MSARYSFSHVAIPWGGKWPRRVRVCVCCPISPHPTPQEQLSPFPCGDTPLVKQKFKPRSIPTTVARLSNEQKWEELFFDASPKVKAQTKGGRNGAFRFGLQPATLRPPGWPFPAGRTELFVVPSSSGAAAMTSEAREAPYRALGDHLSGQEWARRRRSDGGGT